MRCFIDDELIDKPDLRVYSGLYGMVTELKFYVPGLREGVWKQVTVYPFSGVNWSFSAFGFVQIRCLTIRVSPFLLTSGGLTWTLCGEAGIHFRAELDGRVVRLTEGLELVLGGVVQGRIQGASALADVLAAAGQAARVLSPCGSGAPVVVVPSPPRPREGPPTRFDLMEIGDYGP